MKPLISANAFTGYLMFELAVSFAVLLILMQLLLPVLSNVRQQTNTKLRLLSRIELEAAVIDKKKRQKVIKDEIKTRKKKKVKLN